MSPRPLPSPEPLVFASAAIWGVIVTTGVVVGARLAWLGLRRFGRV